MTDQFFERPILNSPYEIPARHWELDTTGQPTQQIAPSRRRAEFITPIPKPKKQKGSTKQESLLFDEGMLDTDLAGLYGVAIKALNLAVKRNAERFPDDFMFQLAAEEWAHMRSQTVTTSRRNISTPPYAFTEQGVAMLSTVLSSSRAVQVNIEIMRAFVRLRQLLNTHADLARKLARLEKKYDAQFKAVFEAIRELMAPPLTGGEMGFHTIMPRKAVKKGSHKSLS